MSATHNPAPPPELLEQQAARRTGSPVIAMTIFVASEAVFFGAFFGIYLSAYTSARVWPPAGIPGPGLILPTAAVALLLVSGAAMAQTLRMVRRPRFPRGIAGWLGATLACAAGFAVLLALSYQGLGFGIGQGIYASLFYVIIGLELAHVVGGVALLGLVQARAWTGELGQQRDPVLAVGIYWYFVVALGAVIYLVLYLATIG